jgi:hypothetical protein
MELLCSVIVTLIAAKLNLHTKWVNSIKASVLTVFKYTKWIYEYIYKLFNLNPFAVERTIKGINLLLMQPEDFIAFSLS